MRGARMAFYCNTIYCEESENLTQKQRVKVKRRGGKSSRVGHIWRRRNGVQERTGKADKREMKRRNTNV